VVRYGVLAGEINFMQKPFSVDTLTKKVKEVLEK
jgi:FixJ family two-component response regulator